MRVELPLKAPLRIAPVFWRDKKDFYYKLLSSALKREFFGSLRFVLLCTDSEEFFFHQRDFF